MRAQIFGAKTGNMQAGVGRCTCRMLMCRGLIALVALLAWGIAPGAASAQTGVMRFDMQPTDGVTKTNYTAITPDSTYSASLGYGFTTLTSDHADDGGRLASLCRDYISATEADFRVDVTNGTYDVWILTGDSQIGETVENVYLDRQLLINGTSVYHDTTTAAYYFQHDFLAHYNDFWYPGMSYYDTFIAPHFHTYHFQATATNGQLDIEWRNMPMDGMIVSPSADYSAVSQEWAQLATDQQQGAQIQETADPTEPMPPVTSADQTRGFILFRKPANVTIYPTSRPTTDEEISSIKTFAAQGQTQAVHFSLLPVENLGNVTVQPTDLTGQGGGAGSGNVISASAISVRVVRYNFYEVGGRNATSYDYQITPYVLDHHTDVPCPNGTTWTWWVNINVPASTPAGIYQGNLTITSDNAPTFELPVTLRVLGFQLDPLPIVQGYYYTPMAPWYYTYIKAHIMGGGDLASDQDIQNIISQNEQDVLTFMKTLGLNSAAYDSDLKPFWTYNNTTGHLELTANDAFENWMDIYAQSGMSPMLFYGFEAYGPFNHLGEFLPSQYSTRFSTKWDEEYQYVPTYLNSLGAQRGWPQIDYCVVDEPGDIGQSQVDLGLQCAELLEGVSGVTTQADFNHAIGEPIVPHIDIATPNWAFPITDTTLQYIQSYGKELWVYNCGTYRMTLGLYPWVIGATGRWQWEWDDSEADPWDDLDGVWGDHHYNLSLMSPNGPVGTLASAKLRAGIIDHRYVATLESAIAAAQSDPSKADIITQANDFINDLKQGIPVDLTDLETDRGDPEAAGLDIGGQFTDGDVLNRARWAMAQYILELQGSNYAYGDQWGSAGIAWYGLPEVDAEYSDLVDRFQIDITRDQDRRAIWAFAMNGGYGSAASDTPKSADDLLDALGEWQDTDVYGDITRLVSFFSNNNVEYWKMSSANSVVSGTRVYAFADPGRQYVIYAAAGGSFSATLPTGTYDAFRYDPSTGNEVSLGSVSGGKQQFTMPDSNDWVVLLKAQTSSVISNLVVNDTANAADWSTQSNIQQGNVLYGDRTYTITALPAELVGNTWIRPANDSKDYTGPTLVSFIVSEDSNVYIVHDNASSPVGSWLSVANGWTLNSGVTVQTDQGHTYSIYSKFYTAGSTVSLGPTSDTDTNDNTYAIVIAPTIISNMVVNDTANAADWSIQSNIQNGEPLYGDRTYAITSMPTGLIGSDWIRPANDSKAYTGTTLVSFTVHEDSDVFVIHDNASSPVGSWLNTANGWTTNSVNILQTDQGHTYSIYRKYYVAGSTVSLGPTSDTDTDDNTYAIVVKPTTITGLTVSDTANAANWSVQSNIQSGDTLYGDRTYTINSLPSEFSGSTWIKSANDSKNYAGSPVVSFNVKENSDVYVVHDQTVPTPSWLTSGGWTDTQKQMTTAQGGTYELYSKYYAAGSTVALGPNADVYQQHNMYSVIVKPTIGGATTTLYTTADTFAKDGVNATTNYGTNTAIEVKTYTVNNDRYGFVKFDLSGIGGVSDAKLRLYNIYDDTATPIVIDVYSATDNSWVETELDWNNMPPAVGPVLDSQTLTGATWYEWDVTDYVNSHLADGVVTFVLKAPNNASTCPNFASRELVNVPQLVITP